MRIEELIIDGFKSYPVRTHVSGFDVSFNAITGLNGSGKSNILDAICFVLGITNLSAVRASNLQDLIYKRGQAGVTKASVTIVFDNTDRAKSPVSFENYAQITVTRQIAMGGLSKYLINGHKATQQAVQNMFQSVQLNINNPNFLIMQGRITKVLNMKPPEILSMIEEAAGTRMFEDRKEKAIKTMGKKDQKVKEITALLEEEITPKLDKLREEKRSFLEYQRATSELERLTRLAKAFEWQSLNARLEDKAKALESGKRRISDQESHAAALKRQIANIEKDLGELEKKREREMTKGGKLQALVEKSKSLAHDLVKAKAQLDLKQGSIDEEKKTVQQAEQALKSLQSAQKDKAAQHDKLSQAFAKLKTDFDADVSALNRQDDLLQTLLTGVAAKGNADGHAQQGGYLGQLAEAKERQNAARTEIEQSKLRIGHLEKQVKTQEPLARKAQKENAGLVKELESTRGEAASLEAQMAASGWDESKEQELLQRSTELSKTVSQLYERRDRLKATLTGMDFSYSDPEPNWDRSRVKGLVASLINLDQEQHKYSTALEICAGGRLYNVVVEDERTGSKLLAGGKLKKRVTLIPLNKISATVAAAQRIGAAQKLAPGKVDLALSLIGYEDDVAAAMKYVFGNTLICDDAETAKRVTFDGAVKMKSVTLDGDVYDPSGTLSGGSKPSSGGILVKVQELNQVEKQLADSKAQLAKAEAEVKASKEQMSKFSQIKRQLDLQRHQVSLLEGQVSGSNAARIIAEVEEAKKSIEDLRTAITDAESRLAEAAKECKRLERDMEEFDKNKDSKLEQLKADVKRMKAEVQKQSVTVKTKQSEVRTTELELEQHAAEVESAQEELKEVQSQAARSVAELDSMREAVADLQRDADATDAKLREERSLLTGFDEELDELRDAAKSKRQEVADTELAVKQLTHEIEKLQQECSAAEKGVKQLEAQFEWIVDEQSSFGQPGTAYDFARHNMNEVRKSCKKLEEQQSGMKKKVNPKVLNMIDSVEKKENELKTMLSTVLKDKGKIEDTIAELDRYKKDALQTTWEKVNGDFGDIFNELLPGNTAKLQPPEGQEITQGLEVKVRLGSVWKQSLTELSGGQRSLIALSLIMSLLQFKPAPMYILDEIDAALDLSHTQHIGQLFRSRFSGSQFIVVSLKEGLFANANVLFRARFRDGTSIVERTAQRGATTSASYDKENARSGAANQNGRGKGGAKTLAGGRNRAALGLA